MIRSAAARALRKVLSDCGSFAAASVFDIRHDPDRQLTIAASGLRISDIGTRFDVQAQGRQVRVAVVEGKAEDVGSWQQGRLSYDNAPLALVAADLRRYAGTEVEVPEALRDRRFSGTLVVGDGDAAIRDLAQVMGLRLGGRAGARRLELPAS